MSESDWPTWTSEEAGKAFELALYEASKQYIGQPWSEQTRVDIEAIAIDLLNQAIARGDLTNVGGCFVRVYMRDGAIHAEFARPTNKALQGLAHIR